MGSEFEKQLLAIDNVWKQSVLAGTLYETIACASAKRIRGYCLVRQRGEIEESGIKFLT